jgi:catechol 2,3-dioxygenase-like lactoylglutathione lyase family enzyme
MSRYFGKAAHVGYVVPHLDQAVDRMVASGIGPFYFLPSVQLSSRYRGERRDVRISVAFGYSGSSLFELLAQDCDTPSTYKEFLARHPQGGMQHVAYYCDDFGTALQGASKAGAEFDVVQEFLTPTGDPFEIYLEPKGVPDALLIQLMLPTEWKDAFARMEKAAAAWDGSTPRRSGLDMLSPETLEATFR